MKRVLFFFSMLFFVISTEGQIPKLGIKYDDFNNLFENELNVVLTGNETLDAILKNAFEEYWEITEVVFIANEELNDAVRYRNKHFYAPFEVKTVTSDAQTGVVENVRMNEVWALFAGGYGNIQKVRPYDYIYVAMANYFYDENRAEMVLRIAPQVKLMNDALLKIKSERAKISSTKDGADFMAKHFNNPENLRFRKLLIDERNVYSDAVDSSAPEWTFQEKTNKASAKADEIAEIYPYEHEIVPYEKILKSILAKEDGVAVLTCTTFTNRIIQIVDLNSMETVYYDYDLMGFSMKGKHYKSIVKTIQK